MDSLADRAGVPVCPAHGVEHPGKSAYRIHMGLALAGERGVPMDAPAATALRLARTLVRNEDGAWVFPPGQQDRWNCSQMLIDGGAICDGLGLLLRDAPDSLGDAERREVEDAASAHAESYLLPSAKTKPVLAQCLWGGLGLARVGALLGGDDLVQGAASVVERACAAQNGDGSWPYYAHGAEPGSEDASAFYHSRHPGFCLAILDAIGEKAAGGPFDAALRRGLDFLEALHRADGRKCRAWEAKRWYFEGRVETASNPWDIHALLLGQRALGGDYAARAARCLEVLSGNQSEDGSLGCGPDRGFQCRTFWTAHVGILGSVLADQGGAASPTGVGATTLFADAGLLRMTDSDRVVLVRGQRPPPSPGFGGEAGGGRIVADGRPGGADRIDGSVTGEFLVPGRGRPWTGLRRHADWLRFGVWRSRCALRSDGWAQALRVLAGTIRECAAFGGGDLSSHWVTQSQITTGADGCRVIGSIADRTGHGGEGVVVTRNYRLCEGVLDVEDRLVSNVALRRVEYRVPRSAVDLQVDGQSVGTMEAVMRKAVRELVVAYRIP